MLVAVQGEAEIISDPEKLPDVVRCSTVSWRCWYMNILHWFYLHSHSRHGMLVELTWNCQSDIFLLETHLFICFCSSCWKTRVASQEPPVWMKIFLPLYLLPLPLHCAVLLPFSETPRGISLRVSFQMLPPATSAFLQNAFSGLLSLYRFRCHGNHGRVVLVQGRIAGRPILDTSSLKITAASLRMAVGFGLFCFLQPEYRFNKPTG